MADDKAKRADCNAWLAKAKSDFEGATQLAHGTPPKFDLALFHCQQAIEKTFKALLAWHDQKFRKTHSLEELGEACLKIEPALKSLVDRSVPMTEYAWKFRYPGEPEEPTKEEALEALGVTRKVIETVSKHLPEMK